jgi:hypothetical protein
MREKRVLRQILAAKSAQAVKLDVVSAWFANLDDVVAVSRCIRQPLILGACRATQSSVSSSTVFATPSAWYKLV